MRQEIELLKGRLKGHHITLADIEAYFAPLSDLGFKRKPRTWSEWLGEEPDDPVLRGITVAAVGQILVMRGDGLQTDIEDFCGDH